MAYKLTRRDVIVAGVGAFALAGAGSVVAPHLLTPPRPVAPPPRVFAGDSLGVGMAAAAGLPSVAVVGVHGIDVRAIGRQLDKVPAGHQVLISMGTNDAHDNPAQADKLRAAVVVYAIQRARLDSIPIVVIGPPRIAASWDASAAAMDEALNHSLALPHGVPLPLLVRLRELDVSKLTRSKDGIHFTALGYGVLWAFVKARING